MPVFYKILIVGLCSLGFGLWFLYDAIKRPLKSKDGYDSNLMEFIRSIGLILIGIMSLLACLKMKF
jgi:hypothetical protein